MLFSHSARLIHLLFLIRFTIFSSSIRWLVSIPPFSAVPSADDDTAQYLSEALTTLNQDQRQRSTTVKKALEETRTMKETMELGFEDRLSAALSILGVS